MSRLHLHTRDSRPACAFPARHLMYFHKMLSEQSCDELFHLIHICCRLETSDNISLPVNNKFREVPFNVRIILGQSLFLWDLTHDPTKIYTGRHPCLNPEGMLGSI